MYIHSKRQRGTDASIYNSSNFSKILATDVVKWSQERRLQCMVIRVDTKVPLLVEKSQCSMNWDYPLNLSCTSCVDTKRGRLRTSLRVPYLRFCCCISENLHSGFTRLKITDFSPKDHCRDVVYTKQLNMTSGVLYITKRRLIMMSKCFRLYYSFMTMKKHLWSR